MDEMREKYNDQEEVLKNNIAASVKKITRPSYFSDPNNVKKNYWVKRRKQSSTEDIGYWYIQRASVLMSGFRFLSSVFSNFIRHCRRTHIPVVLAIGGCTEY